MGDNLKTITKIACIGECMVELSANLEDQAHANLGFAGDTMNTAVYLSRLLSPAQFEVNYMTRLGQDRFSERTLDFLHNENIQTGHIGRDGDRNIGIYAIDVDGEGERSFTYWRTQSAAREMFAKDTPALSDLAAFDVIFLSAITLAILPSGSRAALIAACGAARDQGCVLAFDSNYRPALWAGAEEARQTMDQMWANCTIALPSLDDEQVLRPDLTAEQIIARIAAFGVDEVAMKSGAIGPTLWPPTATGDFPQVDTVVDSTGAGDSFDAGYLAARLAGETRSNAATAGHRLASQVIGTQGAIMPNSSR